MRETALQTPRSVKKERKGSALGPRTEISPVPMLKQFMNNCSLWEGPTLDKFVKDCVPWEEPLARAAKERQEGVAETT